MQDSNEANDRRFDKINGVGWASFDTHNMYLWIKETYINELVEAWIERKFNPKRTKEFCKKWFPNGTEDMKYFPDKEADWLELARAFNERCSQIHTSFNSK